MGKLCPSVAAVGESAILVPGSSGEVSECRRFASPIPSQMAFDDELAWSMR